MRRGAHVAPPQLRARVPASAGALAGRRLRPAGEAERAQRGDRPRHRRRPERARPPGLDGATGQLADGAQACRARSVARRTRRGSGSRSASRSSPRSLACRCGCCISTSPSCWPSACRTRSSGRAEIDVSVPSSYPLLAYLLARMLWIAFRRPETAPIGPRLAGGRAALRRGGRAGVPGRAQHRQRQRDRRRLCGRGRRGPPARRGAMYGGVPAPTSPMATRTVPSSTPRTSPGTCSGRGRGRGTTFRPLTPRPSAFDLACVAGLWLAGRRLRGPAFGLLLAYLWVTFPFTLLVANSGANDALVGALVLAAFLCAGRPIARGRSPWSPACRSSRRSRSCRCS